MRAHDGGSEVVLLRREMFVSCVWFVVALLYVASTLRHSQSFPVPHVKEKHTVFSAVSMLRMLSTRRATTGMMMWDTRSSAPVLDAVGEDVVKLEQACGKEQQRREWLKRRESPQL